MNPDYIVYNILRLTAFFSLGDDIESRDGRGTHLKTQNE
jgi:hypothetical protein